MSIVEAVEIRRQLVRAMPAAFLPNLANSLGNLSLHLSDTGDHAGALTSITEAGGHFRKLAETNPAAFLPGLAASLHNLATMKAKAGQLKAALSAFETNWAGLTPGACAELMLARSRWRAVSEDLVGAPKTSGMRRPRQRRRRTPCVLVDRTAQFVLQLGNFSGRTWLGRSSCRSGSGVRYLTLSTRSTSGWGWPIGLSAKR